MNYTVLILLISLISPKLLAEQIFVEKNLYSEDYLLKDYQGRNKKEILDFEIVDVDAGFKVGSSCGKLNVSSSLQANFKDVFNRKNLEKVGKNLLASSPHLLTCYLSPSACSVLKHIEKQASEMMRFRLDQCAIIDKYTDDRAAEFDQGKQTCVRNIMSRNGGNINDAIESCDNNSLPDISGKNATTAKSKLIEDSARWAGIKDIERKRVLDFAKSIVGDNIRSGGELKNSYGTAKTPQSISLITHKRSEKIFKTLIDITNKIIEKRERGFLYKVSDQDLKPIKELLSSDHLNIQTIYKLSNIGDERRSQALSILSNKIAKSTIASDTLKASELLGVFLANPNLSSTGKKEILEKQYLLARALNFNLQVSEKSESLIKNSLYSASKLSEFDASSRRNSNLNQTFNQINNNQADSGLFDCSDPVFCVE